MKLKYILLALCVSFAFTQAHAQLDDAQFEITFESTWSQATHPHASGSLPSSAHWSKLVGTVHNADGDFIEAGETATSGIENVAETGNNTVFFAEINAEISNGNAQEILDFGALDSAAGTITGSFTATEDYPFLTLVSMIAPSPDWLIMVDSYALLNDEGTAWKDEITFDIYPYDAGTDNGTDYTSGNADTNPAGTIASLQGVAPFSSEIIGTVTITRDDALSIAESNIAAFELYINRSGQQLMISNTSETQAQFELYDITGKKVHTASLKIGQNSISYGKLSSGVYIARMHSQNGGMFTQKVVIR